MTHDYAEGCRCRRDHDRDRERRVIELCADADHHARREESDGRRNGHDPNLADYVPEATNDRKQNDEAHRITVGNSD